jgi:hypothetical protein
MELDDFSRYILARKLCTNGYGRAGQRSVVKNPIFSRFSSYGDGLEYQRNNLLDAQSSVFVAYTERMNQSSALNYFDLRVGSLPYQTWRLLFCCSFLQTFVSTPSSGTSIVLDVADLQRRFSMRQKTTTELFTPAVALSAMLVGFPLA